jgi:hypothetical protein
MNERGSGLNHDRDLVVVAVAKPIKWQCVHSLLERTRIMASPNPGKLRDLTRRQPDIEDVNAFGEKFNQGEHPIAKAIIGAGLVEYYLEILLRSKVKHKDDKTWAMLAADNGPLNSFYSKIAMGYAWGIYDEGMRNDLNIVRSIRNAFAHSKKLTDFDNPAVVNELKKVTRSSLPKKHWKDIYMTNHGLYACLCYRLSSKLLRIFNRRMKARYL